MQISDVADQIRQVKRADRKDTLKLYNLVVGLLYHSLKIFFASVRSDNVSELSDRSDELGIRSINRLF